MPERTCTRCDVTKDDSDFYREPTCVGGIRPECKECTKAAKLRLQNNDVNTKYMREYRAKQRLNQAEVLAQHRADIAAAFRRQGREIPKDT